MNKKRLIAILAAAVMLVSAIPVYADEVNEVTQAGATLDITGSSTVNDFGKDEVYKVTLPTSNSLDFIVDPQNLTSLGEGESMEVDIATTGQGAVFSNGLATIKNESNVPVLVTVDLTATVPAEVTLVGTQAEMLESSTANDMFLVAVPGTEKITFNESGEAENYEVTNQAAVIGDGSSVAAGALNFKLDKSTYVVTNNGGSFNYDIATGTGYEENYDAVAFKIGGVVNKNADWSVVSAAGLYINAVFTLEDVAGTETLVNGLYNVVDDSTITDYAPAVAAESYLKASISPVTTVLNTTAWTVTNDSAADGKFTAKITSIQVEGKDSVAVTLTPATSGTNAGKISITAVQMKSALGLTTIPNDVSFTMILTDENDNEYKVVYPAS